MKKNFKGKMMHSWLQDLYPFHRSITGEGLRKTLKYLKNKLPEMKIYKAKSGTKIFDWKIPKEWKISQGYISDLNGNKLIDYKNNNLHVIGYSTSVNRTMSYKELKKHLFSLPKQPSAIPYLTSYYKKMWGFCLSHNQRRKLKKKKKYKVFIKSSHFNGELNYGEIYLKGKSKDEILFSTNVCHPSLANNELSGPVISLALAKYLKTLNRNFSYRIVFVPETIGALAFLKRNKKNLKKIKAGFVLSCIGDNRSYSLLHSRYADTYADKIAEFNFNCNKIKFKRFSYLDRGSDERQYCSPKFDLPVCSILRTRYGDYPEYHTSLDNPKLVNPEGLENSFKIIKSLIGIIERKKIQKFYEQKKFFEKKITRDEKLKFRVPSKRNKKFITTKSGEPFLHKYNLKQGISGYNLPLEDETKNIIDILSYADGHNDLISISKILNKDFFKLEAISKKLLKLKLVKEIK